MEVTSYELYKKTGINWVSKIPKHWILMKVSHFSQLKSGDNITSLMINPVGSYPVFGGNGLRGYYNEYTHDGEYVLIGRQGALCGNINYASGKFWASEHAVVVTPDRLLSNKWLGEVLRIMNLGQYSVSAAQPGISVEMIARLKVPFPPIKEQTQIAKFLDYKTAQIDRLIEKKKQLLEKLGEQRIATITQAVTKGLNPAAPMKDSGVAWLGEVPAHWEVMRLKFMASIQNGSDYKHVEVQENEDGYPVYGSGGVFRKASGYLYDGRSVLFGRKGTIDKPLLVHGKFWTVDTMFFSKIGESTDERFMFYSALTIQYQMLATQTALPSITQSDLSNYLLACPTKSEQIKIANNLDDSLSKIDKMVKITQQTIEKLNEYRTALITAAVTGKIDVRNVTIPAQGAA